MTPHSWGTGIAFAAALHSDRLVQRSIDGRKATKGHGSADMPVWGEVFRRTKGTETPDTESATWRIAHYLWSIQKE